MFIGRVQLIAVVLALAACGVCRAGETASRDHHASSSLLKLRVGMMVYIGDDANETRPNLCPTGEMYRAWERAAWYHENDPTVHCLRKKAGTLASVQSIIPVKPQDREWYWDEPLVKLRAADGLWQGFTSAGNLEPVIPIGTVLTMERVEAPMRLCRTSDSMIGPDLGQKATVVVLQYYPAMPQFQSKLYVRVLDGRYRNKAGWMDVQDIQAPDGDPVGDLVY